MRSFYVGWPDSPGRGIRCDPFRWKRGDMGPFEARIEDGHVHFPSLFIIFFNGAVWTCSSFSSLCRCSCKCHEMSIDYIVEFDGLCMFMDVYVRYGFTIGHGGFWWFHGQISEVHHSPPRPPPSKAQVQKHWSSQLLEKMLGVYGRWIWYTWGYTLWLFNIAMV